MQYQHKSISISSRSHGLDDFEQPNNTAMYPYIIYLSTIFEGSAWLLAAGIRRSTCSGAEAAYAVRGCDDQPAPDPARCFDCPADPAPAEQ